jgi:hypothetical protein
MKKDNIYKKIDLKLDKKWLYEINDHITFNTTIHKGSRTLCGVEYYDVNLDYLKRISSYEIIKDLIEYYIIIELKPYYWTTWHTDTGRKSSIMIPLEEDMTLRKTLFTEVIEPIKALDISVHPNFHPSFNVYPADYEFGKGVLCNVNNYHHCGLNLNNYYSKLLILTCKYDYESMLEKIKNYITD